jgi:lia operon protein LiaF
VETKGEDFMNNVFWAIVFVSIGTTLLLINLELINLTFSEAISYALPVLLILLGLKGFYNIIFLKRRRSLFWSFLLLLIGTLIFIDQLGLFSFELAALWKLWPLIFIYIGLKMMVKKKSNNTKKEKKQSKMKVVLSDKDKEHVGSFKYDSENWSVEPMDKWKAVGDFSFDFTKAYISEKETDIKLSGWVGDIDILLPEDLDFSVEAYANVGDLKVCGTKEDGLQKSYKYKTAGFDTAARRIRFVFDFKVLDLRIDQI